MALATIQNMILSYLPFLDGTVSNVVDHIVLEITKTQYKFASDLGISDPEDETQVETESNYTPTGRIFIAAYTAYNLLSVRAIRSSEGSADATQASAPAIKRVQADVVEAEFFGARDTTKISATFQELRNGILSDLCECAKKLNISLEICRQFSGGQVDESFFNRFTFTKTNLNSSTEDG